MAKKVTLVSLAALMTKGFAAAGKRFDKLDDRMERGFAAVASDVAEIRNDMASKEQVIALHTQLNSIETQVRGMKHDKLETRVTKLEKEVFGQSRAQSI